MAPKKVTQKRKEGSSSKAERATKKKPKIEATHSGSDSLVPPPPVLSTHSRIKGFFSN